MKFNMRINLIEYFEETVKKYPGRNAVIEAEHSISFLELQQRSLSLANYLISMVATKMPIGVYLPKSTDSVVANLAIKYSGCFYMNLDVKSPDTRIANILNLVKPALVITNRAHIEKLRKLQLPFSYLAIEDVEQNNSVDVLPIFARLQTLVDTDPLCIINTSGSTGTPKGVVLNHKSFIDFTEWAIDTLQIGDEEIIGSLSPLVFDIYSFELCMLMAKGSTIVLIPESHAAFPATILQLLQQTKVSFIFWVPTIMVNIANMDLLSQMPLPNLQTVWFAGEVFPTKQFNYWKKFVSHAKFVNLYGPIEITLDCTYYIVERELQDNEPIPIGFACRNTDVLILNEHNELAKDSEEGELCVRGTSLAMGYYNNPEKTAAAFVQNPLNTSYPEIIYRTGDLVYKNSLGEIIFKGRKDSLVKHLGYRIELGEIEHVIINTLKLVENGCVVYNAAKKQIVLFYEAKAEVPVIEMRKAIATVFPKYMIPNEFIKVEEMARNTNGKIDRLLFQQKVNEN